MTNQNDHPTVKRYQEKKASNSVHATIPNLNASDLRRMCLEFGADDVGIVEIDRPSLAGEKEDILALFPWTKSLVSFVGRINRENLRSPARSIASLELQQVEERLNHTAHAFAAALERKGIRAATPAVGFPMETDQWLGKMHVVWRCADSLSLRDFLQLSTKESVPDHSSLSRTRSRLSLATHQEVFTWVLKVLSKDGLVLGGRIGVDASTMEANAALKTIVRRDTGESYRQDAPAHGQGEWHQLSDG